MIPITVNGEVYQVPNGASDVDWAAKQVAFLQALAAGINSSAGAGVNIQEFGGVGDGVTDDTQALFRALESANGVAAGTWTTGGDPYASYDTRPRQVVVLPFGNGGGYRITQPIPIRFRGVGIIGLQRIGPTEPSEGKRTTIWADHAGDIFAVDALYNVNGFFLRDLFIQKRNAFVGTGKAIAVAGPNYVFGMGFYNVHAERCQHGFYMVCQDLLDGTGSMADLVFQDSQFANHADYGIYLRGHAAIGGIFNSSVVANGNGGVLMGVKGFSIENTDFEGQENPVSITNGSASEALQIGPGNYFEGNPVATTPALISLGLVSGFRVEANQFSGNSLCPRVGASSCSNGYIDEPSQLVACMNVTVRDGVVFPTAGTGANEISSAWNANRPGSPKGGALVLAGLNERGGGNDYIKANGRTLSAKLVETPDYRYLINGFSNVANNDYVFFAFSIKYTVDLPHANPLIQMIGDIGGGVVVLKSWGLNVDLGSFVVGDNISFVVGVKNTTGVTMTSVSAYVSPYGSDVTPGLGARLSQVLQWRQTAQPAVPDLDPLELVTGNGTAAPVSGDWTAGDRVYIAPAIGSGIGKTCTISGTPGTWTDFGAVGAQTAALDGTVPSGTGVTAASQASNPTSCVHKVTLTFAAPASGGASTTFDATIWTIPAKTKVLRVIADITANFTGAPVSAATVKVGKTVGGNEYLLAGDILTAPATYGAVLAEEGASLSAGVGDIPSWSAATAIKARFTTTGGNVNALTTGSVTFYIETCSYL